LGCLSKRCPHANGKAILRWKIGGKKRIASRAGSQEDPALFHQAKQAKKKKREESMKGKRGTNGREFTVE